MFTLNDLSEYEASINGITFVCDNADTGSETTARAIGECYNDKLSYIAEFMISEGIEEYFGEMSKTDIIKNLGAPLINLDRKTITYAGNSFDDMLIIEFKYFGMLESFSELNIDG